MQQGPRPIRRHDHTPEEIRARFPNGPKAPAHDHDVIPYRVRYYAGIVVDLLALLIGAIQLAGPADLGFSPVAARWLGVVAAVLVPIAGVLPNPFGGSKKPEGKG